MTTVMCLWQRHLQPSENDQIPVNNDQIISVVSFTKRDVTGGAGDGSRKNKEKSRGNRIKSWGMGLLMLLRLRFHFRVFPNQRMRNVPRNHFAKNFRWDFRLGFLIFFWVVHRRTPSGPGNKVQKDEATPGLPHPWLFHSSTPPKSKSIKGTTIPRSY